MDLESYIEYLELEKNYSSHTIIAYKKDLDLFNSYLELEMITSVKDVNFSIIRGWVTSLLEEGISNRSVNRKMAAVKSYFKFLLKVGVIKSNPAAAYKSLKVAKKVQIPFSTEEVLKLLDAPYDKSSFIDSRDVLIIELFYATGIRREELINMSKSDVDLNNKTIKVIGKRNKERIVPFVSTLMQHMEQYLLLRRDVINGPIDNLFLTTNGDKIYPSLVYRVIKTYFSKVSLKVKISPHVLRHTFATHLLDKGADLNAVKELLGHTSLSSTQIYTHSSMAVLKGVYSNAHPRSKK
ncbi:integrase/recombinase XerC [Nonlabens dokdonensis]|jgi:integrase/recombinase XerC|uniref:Tyrosine recombinase XerC n=2 Tax=Nonlabens dokdonensis TaxID=328515 RepID=L7WAF9_NONDD|nr:tyrosine-type recombinase/integrase [Nonlabens dokdonensis]AGC77197.1 site-specific integrase/recombinase XerD protein [Nonlabens dokdonensis DSW-6]PZX41154.1 integrase/recombinase XerC [Nonlabens dokdonensis]